jgi:hypothetical protein
MPDKKRLERAKEYCAEWLANPYDNRPSAVAMADFADIESRSAVARERRESREKFPDSHILYNAAAIRQILFEPTPKRAKPKRKGEANGSRNSPL